MTIPFLLGSASGVTRTANGPMIGACAQPLFPDAVARTIERLRQLVRSLN